MFLIRSRAARSGVRGLGGAFPRRGRSPRAIQPVRPPRPLGLMTRRKGYETDAEIDTRAKNKNNEKI